jgi:hypothetical protein
VPCLGSASLLAALDVHPWVAMRIQRHAQIDVTMNVYTEVSDAKTLRALRRHAKQLWHRAVAVLCCWVRNAATPPAKIASGL